MYDPSRNAQRQGMLAEAHAAEVRRDVTRARRGESGVQGGKGMSRSTLAVILMVLVAVLVLASVRGGS